MTAIARRLPFGLARIVPPSLVGFAVINGFTFTCDLAMLTVLHGVLHWPVPAGITGSYGTASGLSYLLNRTFNFHSHGAVGRQVPIYIAVVIVNYLAWILGVGAGLAALGVSYQLARGVAAVCEAVYMYTAMRWVVFRDAMPEPDLRRTEPQQTEPQQTEPQQTEPQQTQPTQPGAGPGLSGVEPGHDGDGRSATPGPR